MITLNGTTVPGYNLTVRGSFRLEERDLGGQSSASDTAEEGIKPQNLSVSLMIRYQDSADLSRLITMAQATDETGKRVVYRIDNRTARAGNVRQVRFSENVSYVEDEIKQHWQVSFTLREFRSVAEKVESRQAQPAATEQAAEGETVSEPATSPATVEGVRGVVQQLNEALL